MAKVTVVKEKNYTAIDNGIFKDTRLSFKAKGLLTTMLSLPPTWNYTIEGLKTLAKDGKDSIKTALKELENFGYLERKQVRNEDGSFCDLEYFVYEKPKKKEPKAENPPTDKSSTEKPIQLNTNISNTKELNNNSTSNDVDTYNSPFSKNGDKQTRKHKSTVREESMPIKAGKITYQIFEDESISDNVRDFVKYFLDKRREKFGVEHIPLSEDVLQKIVLAITNEIEVYYSGKDYYTICGPLISEWGDDGYKEIVDAYFEQRFKADVDYSLPHFSQKNIISTLMMKVDQFKWCRTENCGFVEE